MSDEVAHDASTDRYAYSRRALSRLVLSHEQRDLAERAAAGVPTDDAFVRGGEMVEEAQTLVELAQGVLRWAVIHERQKGTSWEEIGERLGGITRQSAHERYKEAVEEWQLSLVEPFYPAPDGGYRALRIHEAAYQPTQTGRQLDEWARAHLPGYRDDPHPVSGHLSPLSTAEEMVQVLDAIEHLQPTTGPAERAAVYERKASLLERIAAEDGNPKAAEQAAEVRARIAQLRAQADSS
ncbi:hypothetical protein [Streptomyces sp. TLI_105]|uniref:hypothetical protein n=1 Tax=Streptomyces sp. TLI_105 TaxID=1881019 RepID=UPI000896A27C|nr:hypothetical protein [Streptomyces sp. TLI_105]SEE59949.1 hypothetical protein SAMN05428939_8069 [Streptomyces sp. TLI_105]